MGGDRIDDAPAATRAFVGVAMGTEAHVATASTGVRLVKGDRRATVGNMRPNVFYAVVDNALGLPIAAAVSSIVNLFPRPVIVSAAVSFSSATVIGDALCDADASGWQPRFAKLLPRQLGLRPQVRKSSLACGSTGTSASPEVVPSCAVDLLLETPRRHGAGSNFRHGLSWPRCRSTCRRGATGAERPSHTGHCCLS